MCNQISINNREAMLHEHRGDSALPTRDSSCKRNGEQIVSEKFV